MVSWHRRIVRIVLGIVLVPLVVAITAAPARANPGLSVTDLNNGVTTTDLANNLVGSGLSVSNVTYTGDNRAAGTFSGGTGIIGFDSGIVLDTGKVQTYPSDPLCSRGVEGPNNCYEATGGNPGGPDGSANSTAFGTPGDSDLSALSGFTTFDAAVLQFDFVPTFSTVQFKYVFSSEEYSDYSNTQYNDVFGFLVNGTNCALVPGTSQPVSVNTINNGNDVGGDTTPHNAQYFINNVPPTLNTQMDGLTTVLTCNATVNANQTNHMKLAIADASDPNLDSAVFLQAQSLSSGTTVSTSLSGGGKSGATISVPTATAVTDTATLAGVNAPQAGGTVTYTVYSDSSCMTSVASGGTKTVTSGSVPSSDAVTLSTQGTFYWRASYSGDAASGNNPAKSTCGSEVETVGTVPHCTPTVKHVFPIGNPKAEIVRVLIVGTCLSGVTHVTFGSVAAGSFTVVSNHSIQASPPQQPAGTVDVTVTTPFGTSPINPPGDHYTYYLPRITQVAPNSGPVAGGNTILIRGFGFSGSPAPTVSFGGNPSSTVVVLNDGNIHALVPPHSSGTVDIQVTSFAGASIPTPTDRYTYK
jgi:hypothetical protein